MNGEPGELVQITLNYKGVDVECVVSLELATTLLNDPDAAEVYVKGLIQSNEVEIDNSENLLNTETWTETQAEATTSKTSEVWCSKLSTARDHEATSLFLKLRSKLAEKFNDRKTQKNSLWLEIAKSMNMSGFFVGEGKAAAERCRQKFANLQRSYMAHIKHMKTTGEAKKDPPPFFEEMHDLLGSKDKVNPPFLEDSLSTEDEKEHQSTSQSRDDIRNRFSKSADKPIKKPETGTAKLLKELHKENLEQRQTHFDLLKESLDKRNEQTERFLHILEKSLKQDKKRKREDSESE